MKNQKPSLAIFLTMIILFTSLISGQSEKKVISTENAPKPIGPYSQAVEVGDMLFISGQIPIDPATGNLVEGGIGIQTLQVLKNLDEILIAAGYDRSNVVQCQVYLSDLSLYPTMNNVYEKFFENNFPSRSVIEVSKMPREALIEIIATAKK